jgi:hypothetical protein
MRLERGELAIRSVGNGNAELRLNGCHLLTISPDDLRWLCLVAGPALLNELAKEARDGDD